MPALVDPFGFPLLTIKEMIFACGAEANLAVCLDAADIASFDGTHHTWLDVSGNNQHFTRGQSTSVQSDDPTFNGVAGGKSQNEYFSVDGNDFFEEESNLLNFAESWHKNDAKFTAGWVMYFDLALNPIGSEMPTVFSNFTQGGSNGGLYFNFKDAGNFNCWVVTGTPTEALSQTVTPDSFFPSPADWRCAIFSLDETAGIFRRKFSSAPPTVVTGLSYLNPNAGSSGVSYRLLRHDNYYWPATTRLATFFAWNRALGDAELDAVWAKINARYPTIV